MSAGVKKVSCPRTPTGLCTGLRHAVPTPIATAASLHGGVPEACTHHSALLSLAAPAVSNRPASADTRRCLRSVEVRECSSMVKRIL